MNYDAGADGTEVARAGRRLRRLLHDRLGLLGLAAVLFVVLTALLAPWLSPHSPLHVHGEAALQPPSRQFWFGTDTLGRDVLSRVLYGARPSLLAGTVSVLIAMVIGTAAGVLAGYFKGLVDEAVMRVMDAVLAFPPLVLALAVAGILGPGLLHAMLAISLVMVPHFARLARSKVLAVRESPHVEAARALGAGDLRVMWRHVLPNAFTPILVLASLNIGTAILIEAALSFLGLGVAPPAPSWGFMISSAVDYLDQAPWLVAFPGLFILITVLGFSLLGDAIQDAWGQAQ